MLNIILTLVFSIVMLLFMAFPAMKITEWLQSVFSLSEKWHAPLVILITIILSALIGIFLKFY
ncbi:MAG: hypothetical protein ABXS92_01815 [Sulfurimonas sp.]